ncbi:MAG: GNAT family N-acetyltransferase [Sedimenticola sp.]
MSERTKSQNPDYTPINYDEIPADLYELLPSFGNYSVFHSREWHRFISRAMHWKIKGLVYTDKDGQPVYFLPYVSKWRMLKRVNVCLPLTYSITPVFRSGLNPSNIDLQNELPQLEIHGQLNTGNAKHISNHFTTWLDLQSHDNIDEIFRATNKSNIQRKIKKARKIGVTVRVTNDTKDYRIFSDLQTETRKRQGAPTYPKDFFSIMHEELMPSGLCKLFLAFYNDTPVSGVIVIDDSDSAIYGYGASVSDRDLLRLGINQITMWSAIEDAFLNGKKRFEFGSTSIHHPDLLTYKERWGGESSNLVYTYYSNDENQIDIDQGGSMVSMGSWLLRKIPLGLYKKISPTLLKLVI